MFSHGCGGTWGLFAFRDSWRLTEVFVGSRRLQRSEALEVLGFFLGGLRS